MGRMQLQARASYRLQASVILMNHDDMDQMIDGEPGLLQIICTAFTGRVSFCSRAGCGKTAMAE